MKTFICAVLLSTVILAQAPPPAAAPAKPVRIQPPARILEFRAQQTSVQAGQPVMLIWATENPNSTTIAPQPGRVTPRGSQAVTPAATTTYTLTVTGPNNQTETRTVTVNVTGNAPVSSAAATKHPDLSGVYNFGGGAPCWRRTGRSGARWSGIEARERELPCGARTQRRGLSFRLHACCRTRRIHRSLSVPDPPERQLRRHLSRIPRHVPHRTHQRRRAYGGP